jgi:hypothetical protein
MNDYAIAINDTDMRLFYRDVQSSKILHYSSPSSSTRGSILSHPLEKSRSLPNAGKIILSGQSCKIDLRSDSSKKERVSVDPISISSSRQVSRRPTFSTVSAISGHFALGKLFCHREHAESNSFALIDFDASLS